MTNVTDRIEKNIVLHAPLPRVWRALTEAGEFGTWFGFALAGPFVAGKLTTGRVKNPGFEHVTVQMWIERIEPERLFSWRWHPGGIDKGVDYSKEPTTLVEITLEPDGDSTRLSLVESGFDALPADRRRRAFELNDGGWTEQMKNIARHVES
jgi:uncharacterized protein YndB with AHSA1/START domain